MSTAGDPRLHLGQLLVQLTRLFQTELFDRLRAAGLEDARTPHTHVTAFIKADGSRLTELAAQARMTLPAMSELVDDLERLGIVDRRPDPSDGRAKLICLTAAGWDAMRIARGAIADIEAEWAGHVGPDAFESAAQTLDALLRALGAPAAPTGDRAARGRPRPSASADRRR
jgi:DNA-binding MarR family transcriptional regulator